MKHRDVYDHILQTMGHTPIVRLNRIARDLEAEIYVKLEYFNPGGSVKDRIGIKIIEEAEKRGEIKPGGVIVEATSGNTGIGLAITAAVKGYKTIFVMPDKMSEEKVQHLRAFGAKVIICPTAVEPDDPRSYYSVAKRIAEETPNSFYASQYFNLDNMRAHYETTGPEIWEQMGEDLDVFVAGMGTGGTISGTGRYLKEKNPDIRIVGVDPVGSIYYGYFKTGKMPKAETYLIEGIGEDMLPGNVDFDVIDDVVQVSDKESLLTARELVRQEGIFVGGSSGAALIGAIKYARTLEGPKKILVLLPDSGVKYLSKLYNDTWMRENGLLKGAEDYGLIRDMLDEHPKEVVTAQKTDSIRSVVGKMREFGISQVPVLDGDTLVGMITETELMRHLLDQKRDIDEPIAPIVNPNVTRIGPYATVDSLADIFSAGNVGVVVDRGKVIGIITKIDYIDYLANMTRS